MAAAGARAAPRADLRFVCACSLPLLIIGFTVWAEKMYMQASEAHDAAQARTRTPSQDESYMFFEGEFSAAGLDIDYPDFSVRSRSRRIFKQRAPKSWLHSVRIAEKDLPQMVQRLKAISTPRVREMQRGVRAVADFFVYKDMYNPNRKDRHRLLDTGEQHDAFFLIARALERRAARLKAS